MQFYIDRSIVWIIASFAFYVIFCRAFYTWASGSDMRGNLIPRIVINKWVAVDCCCCCIWKEQCVTKQTRKNIYIHVFQKQVKINAGKIERRFGVVKTPFSSSKMIQSFLNLKMASWRHRNVVRFYQCWFYLFLYNETFTYTCFYNTFAAMIFSLLYKTILCAMFAQLACVLESPETSVLLCLVHGILIRIVIMVLLKIPEDAFLKADWQRNEYRIYSV